jgi:hypothetical protein
MTATTTRFASALVLAAAFTASAQAEYRCDTAPSWVDRSACQAADQGPDALRRFVQNMNSIRINIQFSDYVNEQRANSWDAQRGKVAAQKQTVEDTQKVASNERR